MKTKSDRLAATAGKCSRHSSPVTRHPSAFTLIELLVVISIIGILAAFTVPIMSTLKRRAYINRTTAEMAQLETAIDRYKAAYGIYPPSNPKSSLTNQLYYELLGTTNNSSKFTTLDGNAQISAGQAFTAFGVNGFLNCSKPGAGEDAPLARTFLPDLKASQIGLIIKNPNSPGQLTIDLLVASVGGPQTNAIYDPLPGTPLNPWHYNSSSPTNNPGAYDLYVQLMISGKKYLVCNWSKQIQVNSPLP